LIDDATGKHCGSFFFNKVLPMPTGTKTEKAAMVGKAIAEKAKAINIEEVKFDRMVIYITEELNQLLMQPAREALNSNNYVSKYKESKNQRFGIERPVSSY
jgi:large subunit ribosomal protein L18